MKTIRDLLQRDLGKRIVEIIQVDDVAEQSVYDELTEYVATARIKQQYRQLLDAIIEALTEPHDSVGVWVSGFFGSGKSSFAKNLGYALANPRVLGHEASVLFRNQVDDETVSNLLRNLNARLPMEVIMFDISKATEVRLQNEKIAEVVYRAVLRHLDYATDFDVAELEIDLEAEQRLEEFQALCPQVNKGLSWSRAREGARKLNYASAILHRMDRDVFTSPDSWAHSLRGRAVTLTVPKVVERAFELLGRRRPGKGLLFIIDEVGQYVGHSPEKIEDLRALVEEFGKTGRNLARARKIPAPGWMVVTSQEKLEEVVAAIDERRRVSLAKLQDRFRQRIDLAPADIREVVARRVLAKKPAAVPLLQQLFRASEGQLNAACKLDRAIFRSEVTEDDFVRLYAYLPHHIELSISLMTGIRLQPGAVRQLGGSCRTIIKQAYELLVSPRTALADQPIGTLVTLDRLYELLEGNLSTEKQKDLTDIAANFQDRPEDGPITVRVARALCLLEFVRGLARTEENLAACLVDRVGDPAPRAAVARALQLLREAQFVRQTDEGWKLQTAQEKTWDTKRREFLSPRLRDRFELVKEAVRALFGEGRLSSYRYKDLRSFRVSAVVEGEKERAEGELPLVVALADNPELLEEKVQQVRGLSRDPENKHRVYWVAALNGEVDAAIAELHASRQMIATYRQIQATQRLAPEEEALVREEERREKAYQDRLQEKVREALEQGQGLFQGKGQDAAGLGKRLAEILPRLFEKCVPELYPKLSLGARAIEKDEAERFLSARDLGRLDEVYYGGSKGLNLVVAEGSGGRFLPNPDAEVCREVIGYLKQEKEQGNKVTGKDLETRFAGFGYGWDRDVLRLVLAVLLRAGKIEVTHQGRRFRNYQDPLCREPFSGLAAFRAAGFALWESIGLRTLTSAVRQLEDLTGEEVDIEEGAIAAALKQFARDQLRDVLPLEARAQAHCLPIAEELSGYRRALENIGTASSDECVSLLASEPGQVKRARDRARRWQQAVGDEALAVVQQGRLASETLWLALRCQQPEEAWLAEEASRLEKLLGQPDLLEHLDVVRKAAEAIQKCYQRLYGERHQRRQQRYRETLDEVQAQPGWLKLDEQKRRELLAPLTERACAVEELEPLTGRCGACRASLAQLESDLAAVEGLKARVIEQMSRELAAQGETDSVERVKLARFFPSPLEDEEGLEAGLGQLRAYLLELLAKGRMILPE